MIEADWSPWSLPATRLIQEEQDLGIGARKGAFFSTQKVSKVYLGHSVMEFQLVPALQL